MGRDPSVFDCENEPCYGDKRPRPACMVDSVQFRTPSDHGLMGRLWSREEGCPPGLSGRNGSSAASKCASKSLRPRPACLAGARVCPLRPADATFVPARQAGRGQVSIHNVAKLPNFFTGQTSWPGPSTAGMDGRNRCSCAIDFPEDPNEMRAPRVCYGLRL